MNAASAETAVGPLPAGYDPGHDEMAIVAEDLTRMYGEEAAVDELTMLVPRGTIFGFIGPSGSGKTSTVRMLTGIHRPTSGKVRVLGHDPTKFSQTMRARIGYMPQLFVLYPELTVWENLNFAASLYGMPLRRHDRMNAILDFVELSDDRDKLARDISGGMQRRLTLAATLIHRPELLFLDEPTAGIDPVLRRKFWDRFKELNDEGATLFVTTQYVSEASYCDLVGVLHNGRLLMVDTPEGLRQRAFGGDIVEFVTTERVTYNMIQTLSQLEYVHGRPRRIDETHLRIIVDEAATAVMKLVSWSEAEGISVESIEEYQPPFDDVFVELVKDDTQNENNHR